MSASPQSNRSPNSSRPSWRSLLLLVGSAVVLSSLLSLLLNIIQVLRMVDSRSIYLGLDGLRQPIAGGLCALVAGMGWIAWRRPRLKTLALGSLLVVGLLAAACATLRIESFYGNLVPRLTWRWAPAAEEVFASYVPTLPVATIQGTAHASLAESPADFPGYLGRQRTGQIDGVRLAAEWAARPPVELWRHPVGLGWGGVAVVGERVFTQEQRGDQETVVCYHLQTGQELWSHADPVRFNDEHGDGPRATPTVAEGRVYSLGASGLLNCLDGADGQLIWQQPLLADPTKHNLLWGMSGSPLVVDDWVIVTPGGDQGRAMIAFHAADGTTAWAAGDDPAAYTSPAHVQIGGQSQLLSFNGAGLRGFAVDGQPLWLFPWVTQGERQRVNVAQPLVVQPTTADPRHSYVLISSGYGMGMSLVEISFRDDRWQTREVWHSNGLKSKMSNFVVRDGYVYGLDNGILTCLDINRGETMWKRGRYGHGQLMLVHDKLLIQAESGEVVLVAASPQGFTELSRYAALQDKTWNHAALAGARLVVRNDRESACFELPTE